MSLYNVPMGVSSVVSGCVCAAYYGNFALIPSILAVMFAILVQITANLQNSYCELHYRGVYLVDNLFCKKPTAVTKSMELPLQMSALVFGILSMTFGLGLCSVGGWAALIVGILIFGSLYLYNANKFAIRFSFFAPFVIFFFFGPVAMSGTFLLVGYDSVGHMLGGTMFDATFLSSCVMGFCATNVWFLRERMRAVLMPDEFQGYYSGRRAIVLKYGFLTNSVLIFLLQIWLTFGAKMGRIYMMSWIVPAIVFGVNLYVWQKAKDKGDYGDNAYFSRLCVLAIANMIFIAIVSLVWVLVYTNHTAVIPTRWF